MDFILISTIWPNHIHYKTGYLLRRMLAIIEVISEFYWGNIFVKDISFGPAPDLTIKKWLVSSPK